MSSRRTVTIREATTADAPALVPLAEHFLAVPYARQHLVTTPAAIVALVVFLVEHPRGVVLVAEDAGQLVGFLALAAGFNPLDVAHTFCEELAWWVEPAARHAGQVGARLLDAAEEWARANGQTSLKMVAPHQSRVGRYYERRGYTALETAYAKGLGDERRVLVRPQQGQEEVRAAEHD
jgi:GNAT superfamily N-acetyltransferase